MSWRLVYTKQANRDAKKLSSSNLRPKAEELLELLRADPYQNPPPDEELVGNLAGMYSRRINVQHRLAYEIIDQARIVKILRMWSHYE